MKKIAILGGTFDPIHFGHINLAIELFEKEQLDQIIFCPANISPHKIKKPPLASAFHRLNMIKLAIKKFKDFVVDDEEITRKGISYTIDTINNIVKKYPNDKIYFILAKELLGSFSSWKDYKEILNKVTLLVGSSQEAPLNYLDLSNKKIINIRHLSISSTDIRIRLKQKLYCYHLLPKEVLDYIIDNDLYY